MPYATNASDGVRIYYEVEGSGAPLVLLHGTPGTLVTHWRQWGYVTSLSPDYRLVLVDQRGHGRSDGPHESHAYTSERRVGDLAAVLDHLGIDRAHIWGYSMGGLLAFHMAMRAPDRVTSLIVGGQGTLPIPEGAADQWAQRIRAGGVPWFVETWEEGLRAADVPLPEAVREELEGLDVEAQAAVAAAFSRAGIAEACPGLTMPALLYCGDADRFADPGSMREAAEVMPNATFVSLPGLDHLPALVRSDLVMPHVRGFLRQVENDLRTAYGDDNAREDGLG